MQIRLTSASLPEQNCQLLGTSSNIANTLCMEAAQACTREAMQHLHALELGQGCIKVASAAECQKPSLGYTTPPPAHTALSGQRALQTVPDLLRLYCVTGHLSHALRASVVTSPGRQFRTRTSAMALGMSCIIWHIAEQQQTSWPTSMSMSEQ